MDEARVLRQANGAPICRPHLAAALVETGYAGSIADAFRRYLSRRTPFYVPRTGLRADEAIAVIRRAGGVPVLSHPSDLPAEAVVALVGLGLRGIEVDHPQHAPGVSERWQRLAEREGLVMTGGSDYHGRGSIHSDWSLGAVTALEGVVERLRRVQEDLQDLPRRP